MSDFEFIRSKVSGGELLAQLAEEAAELAEAALKLRRLNSSENPAPTLDFKAAYANLREEMADVNTCVHALGYSFDDEDIKEIFAEKRRRWRRRLEEAAHEHQADFV